MKLSFSGKIIGLIIVTVTIVSLSIFGVTLYVTNKEFDKQSQNEALTSADAVQAFLENTREKAMGFAHLTASRADVVSALENKDAAFLQGVGAEVMKMGNFGLVTITDQDGNVVARGHSQDVGDNIMNQIVVKRALANEPSVGLEEGTVVKLSIRAGYPVKKGDTVIGTILLGMNLSSDFRFAKSNDNTPG